MEEEGTLMGEGMRAFLKRNDIPLALYDPKVVTKNKLKRFIRFRGPCAPRGSDLKVVEGELGCSLVRTPLPFVFAMSRHVSNIAGLSCYKKATIFGIDLASAFAVHALNLQKGDLALDLCCAPGAKLCIMAEAVKESCPITTSQNQTNPRKRQKRNHHHDHQDQEQDQEQDEDEDEGFDRQRQSSGSTVSGNVTGVDVSRQRLNVTRNLLRKYKVMGVRLFECDGRLFNEPSSSSPIRHNRIQKIKYTTSGAESKAAQSGVQTTDANVEACIQQLPPPPPQACIQQLPPPPPQLYDKVLVDAECTHDGSIKHMAKYMSQEKWKDFETKVLDPSRMTELQSLQRSLLRNGFRLLKPKGILVYSTCSFCRSQNEDIVSWLLEAHPEAKLITPPPLLKPRNPSSPSPSVQVKHEYRPKWGLIPNTLRFDPITSHTSGLFLAILTKL